MQQDEGNIQKEITVTDLVYSSCSWPGSGGKNLTDSLKSVLAGPAKEKENAHRTRSAHR